MKNNLSKRIISIIATMAMVISMALGTCISFGVDDGTSEGYKVFFAEGRNLLVEEPESGAPDWATAKISFCDMGGFPYDEEPKYVSKNHTIYLGGDKDSSLYESGGIYIKGGKIGKLIAGGKKGKIEYVNMDISGGEIETIQLAAGGDVDNVSIYINSGGDSVPVVENIIIGSEFENEGKVGSVNIKDNVIVNSEAANNINVLDGYFGDLIYSEAISRLYCKEIMEFRITGSRFNNLEIYENIVGANINGVSSVSFDANGGVFSDGSLRKSIPIQMESNEGNRVENNLSLVTDIPMREGYNFVGWNYRGLAGVEDTISDSSSVMYAVWCPLNEAKLVSAKIKYDITHSSDWIEKQNNNLDLTKGSRVTIKVPSNFDEDSLELALIYPNGRSETIGYKDFVDDQISIVSKSVLEGSEETYIFKLKRDSDINAAPNMTYWVEDFYGSLVGHTITFDNDKAEIYLPEGYNKANGLYMSVEDTDGSFDSFTEELNGSGNTVIEYLSANGIKYCITVIPVELTKSQKSIINESHNNVADKLAGLKEAYTVKIADPSSLNIENWDERAAINSLIQGGGFFGLETDLELVSAPNSEGYYFLNIDFYDPDTDPDMQSPILEPEPGKTYKAVFSYSGRFRFQEYGEYEVYSDVITAEPVDFTFNFVPVDTEEYAAEISQLQYNANQDREREIVDYNDLSWLNILITTGTEIATPIIKEAKSILERNNSDYYFDTIGDTRLTMKIGGGGHGSHGAFGSEVGGQTYFYVGDTMYWSSRAASLLVMDNIIFVPEDTDIDDYATTAEKRIEEYLYDVETGAEKYIKKDNNYVRVDKISAKEAADLLHKRGTTFEYVDKDAKAAYLTDYGIALYKHPNKTSEEYFVGMYDVLDTSALRNGRADLEAYMKIDYALEETDVQINDWSGLDVYQPYKVTLGKNEFLFYISSTSNELKEPLADWQHKETSIKTHGLNGFVPADMHTQIDEIQEGEDEEFDNIAECIDGIDRDKTKAYDIYAYTNFKQGNIEDLGNGIMRVMIPLEDLDEDVTPFYYKDGIMKPFKEYDIVADADGEKYVVIYTNHFSTYGITNGSVPAGNGYADIALNNGSNLNNQGNSNNVNETAPSTGDDFNMIIAIVIGLFTLTGIGVSAVMRRQTR